MSTCSNAIFSNSLRLNFMNSLRPNTISARDMGFQPAGCGTIFPPMTIPSHIRGLVFDCDGTIADTMPLHYEAWVAALGEHGVEFPEALFYELAGVPTPRIIEILNERHGHQMPVDETSLYKDRLYEQLI